MSDFVLSAVLELRDRLTSRMRNAARSVRETGSAVREVNSAINELNGRVAMPRVRLRDEATSRIDRIRRDISSLTSKAHNVVVNLKQNGNLSQMKSSVSNAASNMMMGAGVQFMGVAGMAYGIADTIKTYRDFEYQMANVKALSKASNEEFAELNKKARELGRTTMFKASDVAAAESFMALAGWSPKQITAGLSSVLDLAAASGEDLKSVSDIVTDAMTGFGIKVGESVRDAKGKSVDTGTHFADVMAALMAGSNTTVGMAGESAKYSAGVIGALFKSQNDQTKMEAFEDWAVFTGLQANAGIKGSMSGTATRAMFTRMASGQMNASAALKGLGIKVQYEKDEYDKFGKLIHQAGQTRRARDIIGDIREAYGNGMSADQMISLAEMLGGGEFKKQQKKKLERVLENAKKNGGVMSDADKATLTTMMSGQEALAGWLAVLMASNDEWDKMVGKIDNATGEAERMKNVKMDTLKGDLDSLSSAWESLQLTIMGGEGKEGSSGLRSFIKAVTEDLRELDTLMKDGLSFADIGKIGAKVFKQLKDEALEFNGIGSILAGGALVLGLYKIADVSKKAYTALKNLSGAARGINGGASGGLTPTSSVSAMNVRANVVNVYGRSVSGSQGASSATVATGGNRRNGSTTVSTDRRRRNLTTFDGVGRQRNSHARQSWMSRNGGTLAGGAGIGAIFGALDVYATSNNRSEIEEEERWAVEEAGRAVKDADENIKSLTEELKKSTDEAEKRELETALAEAKNNRETAENALNEAKEHQRQAENITKEMMSESVGGAIGGVIGAGIGACLGGPVGMMAGEVIGNAAGRIIGEKASYFLLDDKAKKEYREERAKKDMSPGAAQRAAVVSSGGAEGWFGNPGIDYQTEQLQANWSLLQDIAPSYAQTLRNVTDASWNAMTQTEASTRAACNSIRELGDTSKETVSATAEATNETVQTEIDTTKTAVDSACQDMVASADQAGADMANNINSHTGEVKSVWGELSSWLKGVLGDMGKAISDVVYSGKNASIGHNAIGTSYWGGGLTEVNEHGGEIIDLPNGSRIYPHATTMDMLQKQFSGGSLVPSNLDAVFSNTTTNIKLPQGDSSANSNQPIITITGNQFTVREEADIDKIAHKLFTLIRQTSGNYQYTGS